MANPYTDVDLDLLKSFDKPGPRYTSYPPAPLFTNEYDDRRFEIDLITNNDENTSPISLYLHIPFCDTLCYFCGCTSVVTSKREPIQRYLEHLKKEIDRASHYISKKRPVVQMHWGGGTPSYLEPDEIRDLSNFLRQRFQFAADAEISVEIDPRGLTYDHMKAFRESGVNRISLGVQDFDEQVQKAVHRIQPKALTTTAMTWAQELDIKHINVDLIYGLPLQTLQTFQRTLDEIVDLSPSRIAAFNFAYVPWMKPHQKLIHPEELPTPEGKLHLLKATIETLTSAGYQYIGMDHFAKPDDELAIAQQQKILHRNFQGYSTKAGADLFGFGMSSISHFGNVYSQNIKTLHSYSDAVAARRFPVASGYRMTRDDQIRKFVIMRLMCDLEVEKDELEELFDISFDDYFDASLDLLFDFVRSGFVRHTLQRIEVLPTGRLVLRNIAMCFDVYIHQFQKEKPIFSRTV